MKHRGQLQNKQDGIMLTKRYKTHPHPRLQPAARVAMTMIAMENLVPPEARHSP